MSRNAAGLPASAIRVRALRGVIGLTQAAAAAKSGGRLTREEFNKIESGHNKATSYSAIEGLANAFGLPVAPTAAYLEGRLSLEEVVRTADAADEIQAAS